MNMYDDPHTAAVTTSMSQERRVIGRPPRYRRRPRRPSRVPRSGDKPGGCAGELRAHVVEVRLRIERAAGDALDELAGQEPAAVAVHVLGEPVDERAEVAAREAL